MKSFKKLIGAGTVALVALGAALVMGVSGNASAIACYQYDPNGFQTSQTPVFNNICGITSTLSSTQGTYPLGDEPNFVRIRQHGNDNPLGSLNPKLVDSLTSACNNGDEFDIWTYMHNDASADFNDNGNGSAVAHDVKLHLEANQLNQTGNNFHFSSTVTASNAATVTDGTDLICNGQPVKLTLVANSVHYNNDVNQTTFNSLPDSAVNSTFLTGSPTWGSGTVWGCWNYRQIVVYTVKVEHLPPPPPQVTATCDLFTITAEDRKVTINQFKFTAVNANFKNVVVNWGDNNSNTFTDSSKIVGSTHQYVQDNQAHTFLASALVTFTDINGKTITSGGPGSVCAEQVSFVPNQPPHITPPPTITTTTTPPTELVNTGPGSIAAIFGAVSVAGAAAYRRLLARRLS